MKKYQKIFILTTVIIALVFVLFPKQTKAEWVEQTDLGQKNWNSVASDSTGQYLVGVEYGRRNKETQVWEGSYIYTSNDYGISWTEEINAGQRYWYSVTSDATGQHLVAVDRDGLDDTGGYIYTSNNYGEDWVEQTNPGKKSWFFITSNSTGQYLAAIDWNDDGGYVYTSDNYGVDWIQQTDIGKRFWYSAVFDSTGQYLKATTWAGSIYASNDYGASWAEQTNSAEKCWYTITSDSTGQYLAAGDFCGESSYGGYIYTSNNYGEDWAERINSGKKQWVTIASSSTGQYLAAVAGWEWPDFLSLSNNFGQDWEVQTDLGENYWASVDSDSTGQYLVTAVYGGYLYTYNSRAIVSTESASSTTASSVTLSGNIINIGNSNPTVRGFEYGLTNTYGLTTEENDSFDTGSFSADISSLTCGARYHYRAYATNDSGTAYGSDQTFTTLECNNHPASHSHIRSSGSSPQVIAQFQLEQQQRAINAGLDPTPYQTGKSTSSPNQEQSSMTNYSSFN